MDYAKIVTDQRVFFKTGATLSLDYRREQLKKLRKVLVEAASQITQAIHADLRRSPELSHTIEILPVLAEIDYTLEHLEEWSKPEFVEKTLATVLDTPLVVREPYGVVLLITTWNYPASMFLLPVVPILAAGNTVVVKATEVAPNTSSVVAKIFNQAFDNRLLIVTEGGPEVSQALLKQHFDKIMYTGNTSVGRLIMKAAAENITPVVLELGGKCPVIVEPDADLTVTARRIIWGKLLNNGQTCIAPDYLITTDEVKKKLIPAMVNSIQEFYGEEIQKSSDYSRIVNERHFDRLHGLIQGTRGEILHQTAEHDRDDLFLSPTIVDVSLDDPLMEDELFGPILPILTVQNALEEGIAQIQSGPCPLAAYIFTRDQSKVDRLVAETQSGAVVANDVLMHYAVDTLPFGGVQNSGMGVYRGKHGFFEFSHSKAVLLRGFFGESLQKVRYPPMTEKTAKQMAVLMQRRALPKWLSAFRPSVPNILFGILLGLLWHRMGGAARVSAWLPKFSR